MLRSASNTPGTLDFLSAFVVVVFLVVFVLVAWRLLRSIGQIVFVFCFVFCRVGIISRS